MSQKRKRIDTGTGKLFPPISWAGQDPTSESGTHVEPVPLDVFLARIRAEFPRVADKDLFIGFSAFALSVYHSTETSRKRASAYARKHARTLTTANITWNMQSKLSMAARSIAFAEKKSLHPADFAGDLVARVLKSLPADTKFPTTKGETFQQVHLPSKVYERVRVLATTHNVSKSAVLSLLLERGLQTITFASAPEYIAQQNAKAT